MKKKLLWMVVSCLMILSLVMVSCGQAEVEQTTGPGIVVEEETKKQEQVREAEEKEEASVKETEKTVSSDEPKYGDFLRIGRSSNIRDFDEVLGLPFSAATLQVTNENLWSGDWAKGPAGGYGTSETDWGGHYDVWDQKSGRIAESWELPSEIVGEEGTIIYHIREGVRWALNSDSEASNLVGGRELTVDDVIFSLKQAITDPRTYIYRTNAGLRNAEITAPDNSTVKVQVAWADMYAAITRFGEFVRIVPPEVVEKYGTMGDWRVSVGTGAFILTDFVPGSQATLVRNPNYWMTDPIGPGKGNQLPYLDGLRMLIIPDASTRLAALRTGKLDYLAGIAWEDARILTDMVPDLLERKTPGQDVPVAMRTDKAPFDDIRVRRALFMATDFETIKNELYGGDAQILTWPIISVSAYEDAYLGLDDPEMPASVKELYTYNPEKARQLLAEAGYPDGFKTWINVRNTPDRIDYYSVVQDMWSKVGVDLEIRPMDLGALTVMNRTFAYEQMMDGLGSGAPVSILYQMQALQGGGHNNVSLIDDEKVNWKQRFKTKPNAVFK